MDYLLRDSLYAGVRYGLYDIDRIVYTLVPMSLDNGYGLAFDVKGIHAAEEYLFSRYSMYWQVYFHKTTRSCEALLKAVLQRAHDLANESRARLYIPPNLEFMYEPPHARSPQQWLDAFLDIDDTDLTHAIKLWQRSEDKVLADLADRFINRRLFKAIPVPTEAASAGLDEVRRIVERAYGEAAPYYFHLDRPAGSAYDYYTAAPDKPVIRVLTGASGQQWEEISQVTQTQAVRALGQVVTRACVLLPASCADDARRVLNANGHTTSTKGTQA
jgi:HD superfamily phosphohydrolase